MLLRNDTIEKYKIIILWKRSKIDGAIFITGFIWTGAKRNFIFRLTSWKEFYGSVKFISVFFWTFQVNENKRADILDGLVEIIVVSTKNLFTYDRKEKYLFKKWNYPTLNCLKYIFFINKHWVSYAKIRSLLYNRFIIGDSVEIRFTI